MNYRESEYFKSTAVARDKPISANYTEETGIDFYEFGTTEGLLAGALMSFLLILIEISGMAGETLLFMQTGVNLVLLGVIFYAISKYKKFLPAGSIFKSGMLLGAYISVISGLIIAIANLVITMTFPNLGISLFGLSAVGLGEVMLISFGMFLVTIVNGMIITFICLQFMKEKSSS